MKQYKGTDENMTCKGFTYKIGESYMVYDIEMYHKGFHSCDNLIDVMQYYPYNKKNRFFICEVNEAGQVKGRCKNVSDNIRFIRELTEKEVITKLENLTSLNLGRNKLTGLPEEITKLTNLTYLNLCHNRLTGLPEEITKLTNLVYLNLRGNKLTELPEGITKLTNLTYLLLWGNKLTDLPEGITKLKNLTSLDLSDNNFPDGYIYALRAKMPWCEIVG